MNLAEPRTQYAIEVLGDLFPGTSVTTSPEADHDGGRTFALAPSARRPRLLVPTTPRDAAATALRAYGGRLTRQAQLSYSAAGRALALAGPGLLRGRLAATSPTATRPAGIDDHLSDVVGRQVSIAVHLTPSRANRKPVIQAVAAGEAHPVAFAKMGVDPLTSRLVQQEARALVTLADRAVTALIVPTIINHSHFSDSDVLTMRPLPTWLPGRSPSLADVAAASREVAALGTCRRLPLADSDYWTGVRAQADALPDTPRAARLRASVDRLTATLGRTEITFGASHGDWTPWNMWLTHEGLLVWDWERFESQTPVGLDQLHFRLNDQTVRGAWTTAEAANRLVREAPDILGSSGTTEPALYTVLLYLVNLGLRYEADGQAAAGATVGRLETWLLPAVEAGLTDLALTERT